MALTKVIKFEGNNTVFIWKHPATDFNMGSQLIVHESQEAIFMVNGEILDSFGPGRHTLETENLPVAKSLMKLSTGWRSALHAELYFVNLTEQMAIRWGTDSKIQYLDPEYGFPLEIGACGEMSLSVANSRKLLTKVVGTEKIFTQEQLTKYFRAFLMNRVKSIISAEITEKKINIFSIDQHLQILSDAVKEKLNDDFYDYGINLNQFLIMTVLKPEEDRNFIKFKELHYRKYSDVAEAELKQKLSLIEQQTKAQQTVLEAEALAKKRQLEGYTYQQEKSYEVARELARNEATGEFANIGVGLGMLTGVGGSLGQTVGGIASDAMGAAMMQPAGQAAGTGKFCTNCGHQLSGSAMSCENCGAKVEKNDTCQNCGFEFKNEANFCPQCGTKRG